MSETSDFSALGKPAGKTCPHCGAAGRCTILAHLVVYDCLNTEIHGVLECRTSRCRRRALARKAWQQRAEIRRLRAWNEKLIASSANAMAEVLAKVQPMRAEIRRLEAELVERREESLCASEALVATRLWAAEMIAAGKPVVQVAAECGLEESQVSTIALGMKFAASGVPSEESDP